MKRMSRSAIIHHFAFKSPVFRFLGASRLKRAAVVLFALSLAFTLSCGYKSSSYYKPPSKLSTRVLASQDINSSFTLGGLKIINAGNDTVPAVREISAGNTPGLMVMSPTRATLLAFDPSSRTVQVINTVTESNSGSIPLPDMTTSMVIPATTGIGYAAVPSAPMPPTYPVGAVEMMSLTTGALTTIGVPGARTVISNPNGTQLLVFSNDSDAVSILSPLVAVGPIDVGCDNVAASAACTIVPGFDRPVYGILSGSTVYILNCGAECGGTQASIQTLDLGTMTPGTPLPVDAATSAFLSGSTLYVAGTSPTNNSCIGQTTAATACGRLNIVDLGSMTVTGTVVIPDGYHDHIDLSNNGQLFIGSHTCTNVGNINNPNGEIRGCLAILDTTKPGNTTAIIPPDNGDVTGMQSFTGYNKEYVVEGGNLRVYDTVTNKLQINSRTPAGSVPLLGEIVDVKAIDFF